jgi:PPOX class probable F420-dependent enzyme
LPWSWAEERLAKSRDYWVATSHPDGRPQLTPVWGVWHDRALWFSCSLGSRKKRNLELDARCSVATDDAEEPVVIEGSAELVSDAESLAVVVDRINRKYETAFGPDMLDPSVNACYRVRPAWAFGLTESNFTGSPTRWTFGDRR